MSIPFKETQNQNKEGFFAKKEIANLKRTITSIRKINEENDSIIKILITQNQSLFNSLTKSDDFYQKVYTENETLYKTIESQSAKIRDLERKIQELKAQTTPLDYNDIVALNSKNEKLMSLLNEANRTIFQNQKDLDDLNASLDLIDSKYCTVRNSRLKSINQKYQLQEEVLALERENQLLNEKILRDKTLIKNKTQIISDGRSSYKNNIDIRTVAPIYPNFTPVELSNNTKEIQFDIINPTSRNQDFNENQNPYLSTKYPSPNTTIGEGSIGNHSNFSFTHQNF